MSSTIKMTFDDATVAELRRCAVYRFGDSPNCLSEYGKLATVQLLRRDLAAASKGSKAGKSTPED